MNQMTAATDTGTQDFSRYEFKYLLNAEQRQAVETEAANFMSFDGHVHPEMENSYLVRSLYFDNSDAAHYYEKIDGVRVRRKFRLRTYERTSHPDIPIFMEEKGRRIERTYKNRIRIEPGHLDVFENPARHGELLSLYPGVELVERFYFDSVRRATRPRVLVDYVRRPYVSFYDTNFRITFDSHVTAAAVNRLYASGAASWRRANAGYTILEVKFHRRIPAWFHRIIQAHDMRRLSISKFCRGMEVCNLAMDLS